MDNQIAYDGMNGAPQKKNNLVPIVILIGLTALILFGAVTCFRSGAKTTKQATQVSNHFLDLISKHNYTAAYALLTPQVQATTSPSAMRDLQELVEKRHGRLVSYGSPGWNIQSNNGVTAVTLSYQAQFTKGTLPISIVAMQTPSGVLIYGFHYNNF